VRRFRIFPRTLLRIEAGASFANRQSRASAGAGDSGVHGAPPRWRARRLLKRRRLPNNWSGSTVFRYGGKPCDANCEFTLDCAHGRPTKFGRRSPRLDEIRMGLRYFRLSLFETLPRIYAEVAESVREFTAWFSMRTSCRI